ncbi:MAG TPA: dephospho-CoA kinase [Caulobacteraceae bacterium]|nr:dephospho-CoA kinase [Caulobacteraceae bacterium]
MITLGLTGSIGMGKSATAAMFAEQGCPVYDADAEVHRLYAEGGAAVGPVEAAFPGVEEDGAINRAKLSARVVNDNEAFQRLNGIVWPLLGTARREFFRKAEEDGVAIVVLDIPLLFETGGERNMDAVVVVSAPADVQRARVLARADMNGAKLDAILARQMADEEKRARAHFVVDTSRGFDAARAQVRDIIAALKHPDWRSPRLAAGQEQSH